MKNSHERGHLDPKRVGCLLALCLYLAVAPGLARAEPPQRTMLPEGFPAALAVPFATPVVFLTGTAQIIGEDGRPRPHARTCEFSRTNTADATRLMEHYLAHFTSAGWRGGVTEQAGERRGSYERDDVKATVRLRTRDSGVLAFTLKVQVLER